MSQSGTEMMTGARQGLRPARSGRRPGVEGLSVGLPAASLRPRRLAVLWLSKLWLLLVAIMPAAAGEVGAQVHERLAAEGQVRVLVSQQGAEFVSVEGDVSLQPQDRVLVPEGTAASLDYGQGCVVTLVTGAYPVAASCPHAGAQPAAQAAVPAAPAQAAAAPAGEATAAGTNNTALIVGGEWMKMNAGTEFIRNDALAMIGISALIGCVTFSGSLIAAGKLHGVGSGAPVQVVGEATNGEEALVLLGSLVAIYGRFMGLNRLYKSLN